MNLTRFVIETEVRAGLGQNGAPELHGYAAKFESRSKPIKKKGGGYFYEKVKRGAFDKCLRTSDTVALCEHDPNKPLARVSAGTLQLGVDNTGLLVRCAIDPNVSYAHDMHANVANGNIRSMSFQFVAGDDMWEDYEDEDGNRCQMRSLTDIEDLIDVSFVLNPAYDDTEADARSANGGRGVRLPSLKEVQFVSEGSKRREAIRKMQSLLK